jgi:hypothetical protein
VSTPWASGDQTILADPGLPAGRDDLRLDDPVQRGVLRLVGDERDPELVGQDPRLADLLGPPLRDPDVERLAGADDVGERLHRLLERRLVVVAVGLVEVDVVQAEAPQRGVDALPDVLAREADLVGTVAHRPVDLGEDLQPVAGSPLSARPRISSARPRA